MSDRWPDADRDAFRAAFLDGDPFDGRRGPGAHLSAGSRTSIEKGYHRWLGFLSGSDLLAPIEAPADRITPRNVMSYLESMRDNVRASTIASNLHFLHLSARLIVPDRDWTWLRQLQSRMRRQAQTRDRRGSLVSPWSILSLGLDLMDDAEDEIISNRSLHLLQVRDGLMLALLALWPVRRRSFAALTIDRHVERRGDNIHLLLFPEDTKTKQGESFRLPQIVRRKFVRYLDVVRPALLGDERHGKLWVSRLGAPLGDQGIYARIRHHLNARFGVDMGVHDIRRAAATYLLAQRPEDIGIAQAALQHGSAQETRTHYDLSRSRVASERHSALVEGLRRSLRAPDHEARPMRNMTMERPPTRGPDKPTG